MRTQVSRSRTRAVVVALLVALGVLVTVGVGYAATAQPGAAPASSSQPAAKPKDDKPDKPKDAKPKDGKGDHKDGKGSDLVKGTPCTRSAHACVDLNAQRAWLIDGDGKVVRGPVPISSGKPGQETPRGVFSVLSKDKDHHSREFDNAPMPNSVFFAAGGIAFHGGNVNRASAGCIHLDPPDDAAFFDVLQVADEVQIV